MKISVKLQENSPRNHNPPPLLLRAKIPITIFNLPFLSHFSTTINRPSHLSLSLSTNLPSGPSLKLSYAAAAAAATPPITLTLKSGTGLFGSPNNSPLVISANFSFNPSSNPNNPNPTFSLLLKPQLGSFSLRKATTSHTESSISSSEPTNGNAGFDSNLFGFVPLERPTGIIKDVSEGKIDKESIFKGIQVGARTQMPVAKRVALNFRWWVNFPKDDMPVLRINKIGIQRVFDDVLNEDDGKKKKSEGNGGELEMLKGICFWMKKELDGLTRVNRDIKREIEEMKMMNLSRNVGGDGGGEFRQGIRKKVMPGSESRSSGFEQWRSKRNGVTEESVKKEEPKKNNSLAIDVENDIEFDRDDELFATAGVSRRIKIFEFSSVFASKLPLDPAIVYVKNHIASSDYEGIVAVWDVTTRQSVMEYEEHEKCAWSVDFSRTKPSMLVSRSDNCKVSEIPTY
ncbi:hypothetical protein BUALT_Bualt05G0081200 [Buddleja alternifolia]|uniref:Uncharacterized protein n=1 Tax=Buddleja alternifolia TaxID=168488 RepID=A0AAV6XHK3_9LAMI|nr:hypothetical protein BUALT_Bualt05G0081200 [Buddleja alternifolia]